MTGELPNPLERGTGHGIIGESEFIEKIRGQYVGSGVGAREVPAVKRILAQMEPERIIREICEAFKVKRDELLRKGYKGAARGILMEMLYRNGGMNQREIGELMGIDYSAVSVMRKRLAAVQKEDRNLSARIERLKKRIQPSQGNRLLKNAPVPAGRHLAALSGRLTVSAARRPPLILLLDEEG